jgi:hypothetical protein
MVSTDTWREPARKGMASFAARVDSRPAFQAMMTRSPTLGKLPAWGTTRTGRPEPRMTRREIRRNVARSGARGLPQNDQVAGMAVVVDHLRHADAGDSPVGGDPGRGDPGLVGHGPEQLFGALPGGRDPRALRLVGRVGDHVEPGQGGAALLCRAGGAVHMDKYVLVIHQQNSF